MPLNVEIKARVNDSKSLLEKASKLSQSEGTILKQEDTFFHVPNGRLKLRQTQGMPGKLIFYNRKDQAGPKLSQFMISEVDDSESLKAMLTAALGVKGQVRKRRVLHLVDQTRIHVDQVEGLGDFMELEVLLNENQSTEDGQRIAEDLMKQLDIHSDSLLTGAYMDMLLSK